MEPIVVRPIGEEDRAWVAQTIVERWRSEVVVARGTVYQPARLPGFLAWSGDVRVGLLTYHLEDMACEIVTLDSFTDRRGTGTALIEAVVDMAGAAGCRRLWLITTNDNLRALRFYQKRGFHLTRLYPDAVTAARRIKPEISLIGDDGIPLRDELELERPLTP
jgi:ribosomal protein S18 acetylase RimI-like enzyme